MVTDPTSPSSGSVLFAIPYIQYGNRYTQFHRSLRELTKRVRPKNNKGSMGCTCVVEMCEVYPMRLR